MIPKALCCASDVWQAGSFATIIAICSAAFGVPARETALLLGRYYAVGVLVLLLARWRTHGDPHWKSAGIVEQFSIVDGWPLFFGLAAMTEQGRALFFSPREAAISAFAIEDDANPYRSPSTFRPPEGESGGQLGEEDNGQ